MSANMENGGCSLYELSLSRGGTWARETDLKSVWEGGLCRGMEGLWGRRKVCKPCWYCAQGRVENRLEGGKTLKEGGSWSWGGAPGCAPSEKMETEDGPIRNNTRSLQQERVQ
jgi:hypothetical protein